MRPDDLQDDWTSWHRTSFGTAGEARMLIGGVLEAACLRAAPAGGQVLVVGCGTGLEGRMLAALGWQVTVTDPSEAALQVARAEAIEAGHAIVCRKAEPDGLPDELSGFDAVVCLSDILDRLGSAEVQARALRCLARALNVDGRLVLAHHDHRRRMATDPDDVTTMPVVRRDPEGREYLTFERRRWAGSPRTRRWDVDLHRLDGDGTSRCIHVPMLAIFMTEVEEALARAGVRTEAWLQPLETGLDRPVLTARKESEGPLNRDDEARTSRVVLDGALLPTLVTDEPERGTVHAEDLPVNPAEEEPGYRRSTLLPVADKDGRAVLTQRRQVSLVMLSGGIDSVYTLLRMLRESDDEIVAHHVHLINPENRHQAEATACRRVVDHLRKRCRDFHFTESVIDRRRFDAFGADDIVVAFEAGFVAQAFAEKRGVPVDRWMAGFCLEERLAEWHEAVDIQEHMLAATAAAAWPQPAPRYTVLRSIPKRGQMTYMGEELVSLCWTCRTPVWQDDGKPRECGACPTCNLMTRIRAGEQTIPGNPAAL